MLVSPTNNKGELIAIEQFWVDYTKCTYPTSSFIALYFSISLHFLLTFPWLTPVLEDLANFLPYLGATIVVDIPSRLAMDTNCVHRT